MLRTGYVENRIAILGGSTTAETRDMIEHILLNGGVRPVFYESGYYAGKKICINAVSPSMIETTFLAQIPGKIIEITAQQHSPKRNGTPADIAPVIIFLLSEDSGFMTGVNIPVTGGA